jgi:hypothetical protein
MTGNVARPATHRAEDAARIFDRSVDVKKAYLIGIANVIQVEAAYQAANAPTNAQSLVPRANKGLQGQTLDSVRERLDRWYAANPDKLQRPVLGTLWFEVIAPGMLKK